MNEDVVFKSFVTVFTELMQPIIFGFKFPNGGAANKAVKNMAALLNSKCGDVSRERIIDYCVCQVYFIHQQGDEYVKLKWKISHSFGQKAFERYISNNSRRQHYENKWLQDIGKSRGDFLTTIQDKKDHPESKFINPVWEERDKMRMHNTRSGFTICGRATTLWCPSSKACQSCVWADECKQIAGVLFPEIIRLRIENHETK